MSARRSRTGTSEAGETNGTIKIRVMADSSAVEGIAERIVGSLGEGNGTKLVDHSRPYPCRPPEEGKSRIYLTFLAPQAQPERPQRREETRGAGG